MSAIACLRRARCCARRKAAPLDRASLKGYGGASLCPCRALH
jgi:hypothetical protein